MNNNLLTIQDRATDFSCSLEVIEGQMAFFGELIEDMDNHPEVAAKFVEHGQTQKKLNAIYTLLLNELQKMEEAEQSITEISDSYLKE